jgi:hypothetical protein
MSSSWEMLVVSRWRAVNDTGMQHGKKKQDELVEVAFREAFCG